MSSSETPLRWTQQQQEEAEDNITEDEMNNNKELMFEKVLTPSDVGKLNRIVIPKPHAEAHFPTGADGYSTEGKGLLLNFEDQSGKQWRFRYSYWSSSQSYVLTKGWGRYVRENHLSAGDVVLFKRHRLHPNNFFVSWRRRDPGTMPLAARGRRRRRRRDEGTSGGDGNSESVVVGDAAVSVSVGYPTHHQQHPFSSYHSNEYFLHAGLCTCDNVTGGECQGANETTMVENPLSSGSRTLRLFGVNMECQEQRETRNNNNNNNNSETFAP
ncbi:B3 domain-containing protein At2g36080-like isoform X1 [Arachis ipaensis]|uniref:B3 domain-containing protein At2g36080-like isoform X1 n=1 Tax=Arachis ipaensis TaxID=130454 RepID=UPI000A2B0BD6|nr:B3 domain-containing protein At2g36080-like isoform X1 [Arachis ipaensis]